MVMPKALVEVARAKSCEPVSDFYDRRGVFDPPYAVGFLKGTRDRSAVFFCRRSADYFIVVALLDNRARFSCPTEIRYPGAPPQGLRILHGQRVPLDWFMYLDRPAYGPRNRRTTGPIIEDAEADGSTVNWFYCHEGQWLRRFVH
jgi:hypothetical protein